MKRILKDLLISLGVFGIVLASAGIFNFYNYLNKEHPDGMAIFNCFFILIMIFVVARYVIGDEK